MAVDYYKNLYSLENTKNIGTLPIKNKSPKLQPNIIQEIQANFTDEEIREAAFTMGPFKALGLIRLHTIFFPKLVEHNKKISM